MKRQENRYIDQLINELEANKKETEKKAKDYLEKIGFYERKIDEKVDYLLTKNGLTLIEKLSSDRLQLLEIARCLGITQKSLHEISRDNPEIFDAIDRGRARDYNEVEMALLKLATGYDNKEKSLQKMVPTKSVCEYEIFRD